MREYFFMFIWSVVCLPFFAAQLQAAENCIACHGKGGNAPRVDLHRFRASVHGAFACVACHSKTTTFPHRQPEKVDCRICHFTGKRGAPVAEARQYAMSVHARAFRAGAGPICQTCHGSHDIFPSEDERSRTNRFNIPRLCSSCHPGEYNVYRASIHGTELLNRKDPAAATCFDCHLEHRTPRVNAPRWMLALISECGACHHEQLETYRDTYHGRVTRLGYTTVAKCADCHGTHNIFPPPSPSSTLSAENIVSTCSKCHPGATRSFTQFYAHPDETDRSRYPLLYYTYWFMTALLIAVFAFFAVHTGLWLFRSLKEHRRE